MASLNARAQTLGASCQIQGIPFEAGTQVFFGLSEELVLCVLPRDQVIFGIPCAQGLVHFQPSGQLAQVTLSDDHSERGLLFARGTTLVWNEDGTLGAQLASPYSVDGTTIPAGASMRVDDSGRLVSFSRRIAVEEVIGGIPCQGGSVVTCFASGHPERATLARHHVVDSIPCMSSTDVELHASGRLAVATLGEAKDLLGILFETGTELVFRPDGSLSVAQLCEDMEIAGRRYTDGTYLLFDEKGHLTETAGITWEVMRPART